MSPESRLNIITIPPDDQEALSASNTMAQEEAESFEVKQQQATLDDYRQNIRLRKEFSWALFKLLVFWLVVIDCIVFCSGFKVWDFALSDNVLIALITSTTINVIGLFAIVVRNLFPKIKK